MKLLTRLRLERGWTKAELGRRSRIDGARVGQAENGWVRLYPIELARIGEVLDFVGDLQGLLDEADDDHTED